MNLTVKPCSVSNMREIKPGDPITAEWANNLFDPLRNSAPGEGIIDEDGFHAAVPLESSAGTEIKFARLNADLNHGDECEASIWSGDPLVYSGNNETVYDWFLESGMKLTSGTRVMLTPISGKLYVTQSNRCPVSQ